jgi:hypothetical protein
MAAKGDAKLVHVDARQNLGADPIEDTTTFEAGHRGSPSKGLANEIQHPDSHSRSHPVEEANNQEADLVWASFRGATSEVQQLLDAGENVDAVDDDGSSALAAASWANEEAVCSLLLRRGANPNFRNRTHGWTPLFAAAAKGHVRIVSLLLENGAYPNIQDSYRKTAVDYALMYGHTAVVEVFKRAGAKPATISDGAFGDVRRAAQSQTAELLASLQRGGCCNKFWAGILATLLVALQACAAFCCFPLWCCFYCCRAAVAGADAMVSSQKAAQHNRVPSSHIVGKDKSDSATRTRRD